MTSVKYRSNRPNAIPVIAGSVKSRTGKTYVYGSISAFAENVLGNINKRHTVSRRLRASRKSGGVVEGYTVNYADL